MSQVEVNDPPPRWFRLWLRRWRSWLLVLAIGGAAYGFYCWFAGQYLNGTLAELDRNDPGWRLEELEAARPEIPDDKNSARCVAAAIERLPKNWDALVQKHWGKESGRFSKELREVPPTSLYRKDQLDAVVALLAEARSCLVEARRLADLSEGRFPIPTGPKYLSDRAVHGESASRLADLLGLDAVQQAHEGKLDQALAACRAALNAGRSLGDEPHLFTQQDRTFCLDAALSSAERVLAQGEPSASSLAAWQGLLQIEQQRPALLIRLKTDRAFWHEIFLAFESRDPRFEELWFFSRSPAKAPGAGVMRALAVPHIKQVHAEVLRYLTGTIEAARLPAEEQGDAIDLWQSTAELPHGVNRILPSRMMMIRSLRQSDAELRCALVAAAVERFRREHGDWPDTLAELCPTTIASIPADPFGGALRYRRLPDGVIVYSIGADLVDNGGKLDRKNPRGLGTDIGFQLWDVSQRRRPALPPFVGPQLPGPRP